MGAKEVEDASLAAILGPLGREAALASERMREVEEWIWAAEAEGLSAEEIAPARQRLAALARDNRSINWRREEEKAAEEKAWQAELRAAAENLRRAEQEAEKELSGAQRGGGADLKAAITRAYHAGVDVKQLISARQKLLRASGVTPPPAIARGAETRSLAKDMLQAMKARDVEKLRATLDAAAAADLQLQGLEAIRRKLATWKPTDKREPQTRLRIILPDGRRGWLPVEPEWLGSAVLSCVQEGDEYRLGREASTRGAVTVLEQRLQLDRPLCEQPEFLEEGATLCICRRSAPEPPAASAEWEEVVKGISEPMPSFTKVQRLLGSGQAVVLAWGDVEDRCGQVIEAVGACRLVLAGQQAASWRPRLPFTAMALDVDALVTGEVVSSILAQIEAWVQRPFLLVLVSRAYLSRRLAHSFRQHLPQDIALLPCPPDLKTACAEVPEFGNRFLEEARRLQAEGLHLTQSCLDALERCGTFAHGKSCVRAAVLNGCKPYKFPRWAARLLGISNQSRFFTQ